MNIEYKPIRIVRFSLLLVALIGMSGCAEFGRVNGGGWVNNYTGGGTSNFGFNANGCKAEKVDHEWVNIKGHFNYVDQSAYHETDYPRGGVKLNGKVTGVAECEGNLLPAECNFCENGYAIRVDYRSTNPFAKGEGKAKVCVYDNGEGINAPSADEASIFVLSGPFQGYYNHGDVQGNIQGKECKEEEEI
jgi:hypothetical protein